MHAASSARGARMRDPRVSDFRHPAPKKGDPPDTPRAAPAPPGNDRKRRVPLSNPTFRGIQVTLEGIHLQAGAVPGMSRQSRRGAVISSDPPGGEGGVGAAPQRAA